MPQVLMVSWGQKSAGLLPGTKDSNICSDQVRVALGFPLENPYTQVQNQTS